MKKLICFALASLLTVSLFGCSLPFAENTADKAVALSIGEVKISDEVYAYYYSASLTKAEQSSDDLLDTSALKESALDFCRIYASCIELFNKAGLKLDTDSLKNVAAATEEKWHLYSEYYKDCGISKQTVAEIMKVKAYRTSLLLYFYGKGGENEIGSKELVKYFDSNYVAFQSINGYFNEISQTGEEERLSDERIAELKEDFKKMKSEASSGKSLAELNDGADVPTVFSAINDDAYPEGFLSKVAALDYGKPTVIETDDNIFLVVRVDAKSGENDYFSEYKTEFIDKLAGDSLDQSLLKNAENYESSEDAAVMEDALQRVVSSRNSRK